jgi:nicotinamide-nucleotide amidase
VERLAKRTYRVFGKGESQVAGLLDGVGADQTGVSFHYQATFPEVLVKVLVRHSEQERADGILTDLDGEFRQRLGHYLYGFDDDSLASVVGAELQRRRLSLATAESCTGGGIGALITDIPGSSSYYVGGAVTYSNSEKVRQLGVLEETLSVHGAVSEECVREMAEGIRGATGADYGVSVSGVAGPGGGTEDRPTGTVWIALAAEAGTRTRKLFWPGDRRQVRRITAFAALAMVLRAVQGEDAAHG